MSSAGCTMSTLHRQCAHEKNIMCGFLNRGKTMFALLWSLMISTLVFFLSAWYTHQQFDRYELPRGMTRNILVITIASLLSWGAGALVDQFSTVSPQGAVSSRLHVILPAKY